MIVLDTTVLAYAVGDAHPLRDPCRRLLSAHAMGRVEAATTLDVIQNSFTSVREGGPEPTPFRSPVPIGRLSR